MLAAVGPRRWEWGRAVQHACVLTDGVGVSGGGGVYSSLVSEARIYRLRTARFLSVTADKLNHVHSQESCDCFAEHLCFPVLCRADKSPC